MSETLPLSELTAFIRRVFALNLPEAVWVGAELAQVNIARGHAWLTLVEKSGESDEIVAQLDAVVWSGTLNKLRKKHGRKLIDGLLQDGMSVRIQIFTSFHERYGLRLVVEDIDPAHTIGSLERRRQLTLEALSHDGLLDRNAKLPLPSLPLRLAVISSDTAAGLADFSRQLETNPYGYQFHTTLYPAAMQGVQTTEEVTKRLRQIGRRKDEYDVIVIVRGGGGKTDLAAFDDEELCRAVAAAPLPVLVGIGHEVDDTVLDRVVHRSLKTPTAVAVFLIDTLLGAEAMLLQTARSIALSAERQWTERANMLERYAQSVSQAATASVNSAHLRLAALEEQVNRAPGRAISAADLQIDNYRRLLDALRPEATLERGYALVSQAGKIITSPQQLEPGKVDVRLKDGRTELKSENT